MGSLRFAEGAAWYGLSQIATFNELLMLLSIKNLLCFAIRNSQENKNVVRKTTWHRRNMSLLAMELALEVDGDV